MSNRPSRWLRWTLAAGLAAAAVGCGLRTDPRPPEETAPIIEGEVRATAGSGKVELSWKRADHSADGRRLDDLAAFVVERAETTPNGSGDDAAFIAIARIDVVDQERLRRRSQFRHTDASLPSGAATLWYRVRAVTADGQQGPPSQVVAVRLGTAG